MIKYEIHKYEPAEYGVNKLVKFINKSELEKFKKDDWLFIRKKYFILTSFLDWWKPISFTNKVGIFGIILSAFLISFFWSLDKYFEYKKENLKIENDKLIRNFDSLKTNYHLINRNFQLSKKRSDSLTYILNEKNKSIENLKEELKSKTTSGKK